MSCSFNVLYLKTPGDALTILGYPAICDLLVRLLMQLASCPCVQPSERISRLQHWLQNFESIGENCEFGFVQRELGIEVSTLLRWALLDSVAATAVGIRCGFEGAFAFENLHPAGGGTMVRDIASGVAFHTSLRSELQDGVWRFVDTEGDRRRIHAQELQKFLHLRQKFCRDLIAGERIYVAKRNDGLTEQDAEALIGAISRWGNGRLLYLTEDEDGSKSGKIERVDERVIHGWIDRFAPFEAANTVSLPSWESVLRSAADALAGSAPGRSRARPLSRRAPVAISDEATSDQLADQSVLVEEIARAEVAEATIAYARSAPVAGLVETANQRHLAPTSLHGLADVRRAAGVRDGHVDLGELADLSEQGTSHLPERFSHGMHFTELDKLARSRPRRAASRPSLEERPAGYFSTLPRAVAARLRSAHIHQNRAARFAPEHIDQLRQMFAPAMYAGLVGPIADDPDGLWDHYLAYGLPAGIAPTPLFDAMLYRRQAVLADLPPPQLGELPVMHWLRVGRAAGIVPSPAIDMAFYRANNPDVPGTDADAFHHYLSAGLYENRPPTLWFDPDWYTAVNGSGDRKRFDHFIAIGVHEGRTPSALVEETLQAFGQGRRFDADLYDSLVEASRQWHGQVPAAALSLMVCLYSFYWQDSCESPLNSFVTYLREGVPSDRRPGPLFDEAIYRRRATEAGLPAITRPDSAVLHWLKFGYAAKIVPTERFNEAIYLAKNPDVAQSGLWGFEHFLRHGVHEGRLATETPTFRRREALPSASELPLPALYRQWYSMDFPTSTTGLGDEIPKAAYDQLHALLGSENLAEIFSDAQAIEPDVGELSNINDLLLLPFYDGMALRHAEVCRRLPRSSYDTVICVPWIRVGGADLVAGLLAKSVLRVRPDESVLVLRVDNPHFERANWLPPEADVVDVSDLIVGISEGHQHNLLRCLFRGVAPRRVINVNSRLCWSLFRAYGANLAYSMRLYAYMFCWDQTPSGLRAGYPAEFYADTAEHVTAFLTDTNYLRDELAAMYRLPPPMAARIVPLFTPAQSKIWTPSAARVVQDRAEPGSRRLVLWAGRLDRQKRFDLVQEIARLMPDTEFRCWGAALLDTPPNLDALPSNVTMQGSFDSFDALPLLQAGAWLFTALWEGMPTTLIELATRGVPIVASAVGGVPELITAETGWAVSGDAPAEAYATSLREVLSSPHEATRRAEALQRLVGNIYNEQAYDDQIHQLFSSENGVPF